MPKPGSVHFVLAGALVAILCFQVRMSADTIHLQRTLDFYIPFLVAPFSDRVYDVQGFAPRTIRSGDRLLLVNGQPFRSESQYLRDLWNFQHERQVLPPTEWRPFTATISSDSGPRLVEEIDSHCTCGTPTMVQALGIWMAPPLVCVLLGFAGVAMRPSSILAWAFLALMLSLSQLQFWKEPHAGFQVTATPMLWPDGWRIPGVAYREFVQHLWPAALLASAAHVFGPLPLVARWIGALLITVFVSSAALKSVIAVAWSEGWVSLAPIYQMWKAFSTESIAISLMAVAVLAFAVNKRFGMAAFLIAVSATAAVYWSASPIGPFTPELIILASVGALVLSTALIHRKRLGWRPLAALVLSGPLVINAGAVWGNYWWPFAMPTEHWPWIVLATAGGSLACVFPSVVRQNPN